MRTPNVTFLDARLVRIVAAVIVGLSVGTVLQPGPVALPTVGSVPGPAVGLAGLVVGGLLYYRGPTLLGSGGCGCSGDCECA